MSIAEDIEEFIRASSLPRPARGRRYRADPDRHLLTITCPCGVVFSRYVTPDEAAIDLTALARRN